MASARSIPATPTRRRSLPARLLRWCVALVLGVWLAATLSLISLRWVAPPSTALQIERLLQAQLAGKSYHRGYTFVSIDRISPDFQHAVVAAEDARFYQHRGFDWTEIRNAVEEDVDDLGGHTPCKSTSLIAAYALCPSPRRRSTGTFNEMTPHLGGRDLRAAPPATRHPWPPRTSSFAFSCLHPLL